MRKFSLFCIVFVFLYADFPREANAGELRTDVPIRTDGLRSLVTYDILLPDDYESSDMTYPLVLFLHGGGDGGNIALRLFREWIEELWQRDEIPPMVFVTPHVGPLCFYLDFKDGSKHWQSDITGPFLKSIRDEYRVHSDPDRTLLAGISMGGAGALTIALKSPDSFHAVAAIAPAVQPASQWKDVDRRMFFWFTPQHWEARYGKPISSDHWASNNPASLVQMHGEAIRESGLHIYLECGDEDYLELHKGADFLHRAMWDAGIKHEYHVFTGADHVGRTIQPRVQEAIRFLAGTLDKPEPDPAVQPFRENMDFYRANGYPRPSE